MVQFKTVVTKPTNRVKTATLTKIFLNFKRKKTILYRTHRVFKNIIRKLLELFTRSVR